MNSEKSISIYLWLFLVPFFWGGAFVAAEHLVTELPPITAAPLRFGLAGLLLMVIVAFREKIDRKAIKKRWLALLLMAVTGIFGYNLFFFIALDITTAINGSLIVATSPVFLTLGAVLFLNEKWNKQLGLGIAMSLIGVIIVISKGSLAVLLNLAFNQGDLLFLGALFCWVLHGLLGKIVMKDVTPVMTTTITTLVGAGLLAISSIFENGWGNVPYLSAQAWMEMAFMVACSSVLGFLLWNHGIKKIGASKSSIYMNLVPINTALIAVLIYGSPLTFSQVFGMIMVLTGVYLVTFHQYLRNKRAARKMKASQQAVN